MYTGTSIYNDMVADQLNISMELLPQLRFTIYASVAGTNQTLFAGYNVSMG